MKKIYLFIFLITIISFSTRFWKISSHPQSLSMDEVGFGYNAYSILKSGRDEFGFKFPLAFKNLGDYKLPINVYLTSVSIFVFGENEFAVRFPSAFFGALTPIIFILFLRKFKFSWSSSLLTAFWLSLLGWHIFDSRVSYEAITALFFLILGILFFPEKLSLSVLFFSLSVYTYNAERLFIPILFIFLIIIYKNKLKKYSYKELIFPVAIIILFSLPLFYQLITGSAVTARAQNLWIGKQNIPWTQQYLSYFSPIFCLWKGIGLTLPNYPDIGLIYLIDTPILITGIYHLIKSKNKTLQKIALIWLFLAPLPASFTRGDPSQIRILLWLPLFGILMASGFENILKSKKATIILPTYFIFLAFSFLQFADLFFNHFDKFYGDLWHYGYKEVSLYSCQNHNKYNQIIITDKYGNEIPSIKTVPYLYILFYCKWDPNVYFTDKSLYNVEMRQPMWRVDSKLKNTLLIGSPWDFPENFPKDKITKIIYFPSGKPAFFLVETKNFAETDNFVKTGEK